MADALYGAVVAPVHSYVERAPGSALNDLVRVAWIQRIGRRPTCNATCRPVKLNCTARLVRGRQAMLAKEKRLPGPATPRLTPRDHKAVGVVCCAR